MKQQRGFTLLEIIFVLTIISILAVIALPMFFDYKVRAKISEGFALADPVKFRVAEYYLISGNWPDSNVTAGINDAASFRSNYVDSISISGNNAGAKITITYLIPQLGSDNTIVMAASNPSGRLIEWTCSQGSVIEKYRPAGCKP